MQVCTEEPTFSIRASCIGHPVEVRFLLVPSVVMDGLEERKVEPEIEKSSVTTFDNRKSVKKLKEFGSVSKFKKNFE